MNINSYAIAVIDSGVGGISLLKQLRRIFKNENFIYFADNEFMPYGNKTAKAIQNRMATIVKDLINVYRIKAVVLACNTASTVALQHLRSMFNIPIYGVDPTLYIPNNAVILCTKLTAKQLIKSHFLGESSKDLNCKYLVLPKLATFVENNCFDRKKMNKKARQIIDKYQLKNFKHIVLGCTHYEYFYDYFKELLPTSTITLPSKFTTKTIQNDLLPIPDSKSIGMTYFLSALPSKSYLDKLYYIFSH